MSGPACSICRSQNSAAIDEVLVGGAALVPTATRFGVSKSALGRHKVNCLAPRLAAAARITSPAADSRNDVVRARAIATGELAAEAADVLSLTRLVERLAASLSRLDVAAEQAASASSHGALAALSGQLHRGIEAAAKIQRFYEDSPPTTPFSVVINLAGTRPDHGGAGGKLSVAARAGEPRRKGDETLSLPSFARSG